jgi:hypothetical protein
MHPPQLISSEVAALMGLVEQMFLDLTGVDVSDPAGLELLKSWKQLDSEKLELLSAYTTLLNCTKK